VSDWGLWGLTDTPKVRWRLAMAWDEWADKIRHHQSDFEFLGGKETRGRYVIPQAGAFLDYRHDTYHGKPAVFIDSIYTHPDNRKDGVAEAMVRRLRDDHPDFLIDPGYMTSDGQKFHDRMLDKEPTAKELVTAALLHASEALGDCYEAAARYLLDNVLGMGVKEPNHNLRLVHGEVAMQGPHLGKTMGHAWIEDGDNVIDQSNGRDIRLPKNVYYQLGKINELNNFHVYTPEEARSRLIDLQHYGPWDLSVNGEPPPGRVELDEDDDEEYYDDDEWDDDDH
jgi:GNAT superfamily N-acetyltransferase